MAKPRDDDGEEAAPADPEDVARGAPPLEADPYDDITDGLSPDDRWARDQGLPEGEDGFWTTGDDDEDGLWDPDEDLAERTPFTI